MNLPLPVQQLLDQGLSRLKESNERQRMAIFGGLLFLLFLLDYFVIMRSQITALTKIMPEVTILAQNIERAQNDLKNIDQYTREVTKLKDQVKELDQKLRTKDEISLILERISQIANKNDFKLEQIAPSPQSLEKLLTQGERTYFAFPIMIEARAGYHSFGRFVNQLEREGPLLRVNQFSISSSTGEKNHKIKLTLRAIIYEKVSK